MFTFDTDKKQFTVVFKPRGAKPEDPGFTLVLRRVPNTEILEKTFEFKMASLTPNYAGYFQLIANDWWLDFSDVVDAHGSPIPNTPGSRLLLLNHVPNLFSFIIEQVGSQGQLSAEGKEGSGSA